MLSFVKYQWLKFLPAKAMNPAEAGGGHVDSMERSYLWLGIPVTVKEKEVLQSTIMFGILFGLTLLCLLFMIKKSNPETLTAAEVNLEETRIDMVIAKLNASGAEMLNTPEKMAKKFYTLSNFQQIGVDELIKDPFKMELTDGSVDAGLNLSQAVKQRAALVEQASKMQLLSIITTDSGKGCMIDYKLLYQEDSIAGFKVVKIGDNFVELQYGQSGSGESEPVKVRLRLSK